MSMADPFDTDGATWAQRVERAAQPELQAYLSALKQLVQLKGNAFDGDVSGAAASWQQVYMGRADGPLPGLLDMQRRLFEGSPHRAIEQAQSIVPDTDGQALRRAVLLHHAYLDAGQLADASATLSHVVALAKTLGTAPARAHAIEAMGRGELEARAYPKALAVLTKAEAAHKATGNLLATLRARARRAQATMGSGRVAEGSQMLGQVVGVLQQRGYRAMEAYWLPAVDDAMVGLQRDEDRLKVLRRMMQLHHELGRTEALEQTRRLYGEVFASVHRGQEPEPFVPKLA